MAYGFPSNRPFEAVNSGRTVSGRSLQLSDPAANERLGWILAVHTEELVECFILRREDSGGEDDALVRRLEQVKECETAGDCPSIDDLPAQHEIDAALGLLFIDSVVEAIELKLDWVEIVWRWDRVTDQCREAMGRYFRDLTSDHSVVRSEIARSAAYEKHRKSPHAKAKEFVKDCWVNWKSSPQKYPSLAQFARDMADKFPDVITTPVTVERWVREWRRYDD